MTGGMVSCVFFICTRMPTKGFPTKGTIVSFFSILVSIGSDSTATSMAEELRHVLSFYSEDKAKVN